MDFKNQRFVTKGASENISQALQLLPRSLIDNMPPPKDYLQIFKKAFKAVEEIPPVLPGDIY